LRGVDAILEELDEGDVPPPSTTYPPEMEPDAIFFGGTDPGRFVPTYMIYSAKVRPDVFLITQNALADNTYMAVMRDLYGDRIWIPAIADSNRAFKKYVEDVHAGRISAGAEVVEQGGRVSVQGVQGVMMINGILTKDIFDYNKHKHAFYVEESYVIHWMYPYLTPHGLIMKINRDALPNIPPQTVKDDHEFWTWYVNRLLTNEKFQRDVVARKTFSKLRSAIGGLYVFRAGRLLGDARARHYAEAEYAFKQAIKLYDLSPEANFRLADALVQQRKFDEAIEIINNFLVKDELNTKVEGYRNQLIRTRDIDKRRAELEPMLAKGAGLDVTLELLGIYRDLGQVAGFNNLARQLLTVAGVPLAAVEQVGKKAVQFRRWDIALTAYQKAVQAAPQKHENWIELAATQLTVRKHKESIQSLQKAVETGGEIARRTLRADKRFNPIRSAPIFQQLVPPQAAGNFNLQIPGR
jgi:tetratricopeptide (TPR) repeat protein